jgi:hypothetical protein
MIGAKYAGGRENKGLMPGMGGGLQCFKESKRFFFEKKKQKTFAHGGRR